MSEHEFVECPECKKEPGTPVLCESCLHNRSSITKLGFEVTTLQSAIKLSLAKITKMETRKGRVMGNQLPELSHDAINAVKSAVEYQDGTKCCTV